MSNPAARPPTRLLLVDDHPLFRDGLRAVLDMEPDMEVVGEAGSAEEAVEAAATCRPSVVVMDLHLPGMNGVEATRRIVAAAPDVRVLVLTMSEDDASVVAALRAGASGYVLKGAGRSEIVRAIQAVASGQFVFDPTVAGCLITRAAGDGRTLAPAFPELTEREREVLELMAQGHGNDVIARRLFVSGKTVRNNVSNIFTKLQVSSRAEAIVRAREAGLGMAAEG